MLKSNIDVFVCDIISLLAQVFIVSSNRVSKEVSMKTNLWLSFCDMTVPSKQQPLFSCLCAGLFPGVISVSQTLMTPE